MAMIWGRPTIQLKLGVEFSEDEARALYEITQHDVDCFIKTFYDRMGKNYLEKHEQGMRSLFDSFTREAGLWLNKVDAARKTFNEEQKPHAS